MLGFQGSGVRDLPLPGLDLAERGTPSPPHVGLIVSLRGPSCVGLCALDVLPPGVLRTVPRSLSLPQHGHSWASAALSKARRFSDITPPQGGGRRGGQDCHNRRNKRPRRVPNK